MTTSLPRFVRISLGVVMLVLAACESAPDDSTPTGTPTSEASSSSGAGQPTAEVSASPSGPGAGEVTSVFEIDTGDCFNADTDHVSSVLVVDCSRPHAYEAFHLFDHEAGPTDPYPGDEAIRDYADTMCQAPFEEFVGIGYEASIWFITSVTPSAETWAGGDREIICTLDQQDQDGVAIEVTGSAKASAE